MKRQATQELAPEAKKAKLEEVEAVILNNDSAINQVLARVYADEVSAGRWQPGTFQSVIDHYGTRKPEYKSAQVEITYSSDWWDGLMTHNSTYLPILAAKFLDMLSPGPEIYKWVSKYAEVEICWGVEATWELSEEEPRCSAEDWPEKGLDSWHNALDRDHKNWKAYEYFLEHHTDSDVEQKIREIIASKDSEGEDES